MDATTTALLAAYRLLLQETSLLLAEPNDPRYRHRVREAIRGCNDREALANGLLEGRR